MRVALRSASVARGQWFGVGLVGFGVGCGGLSDEGAVAQPAAYAIVYDGPGESPRRLSVVSTLTARGTAELEAAGQGVPLPEPHQVLLAPDYTGTVYSPNEDALTELFIESGPSLREGRTVSLRGLWEGRRGGLSFIFVSPSNVYVFGNERAEIVVWNPREMTTRLISLGLDIADGYDVRVVGGTRRSEGEFMLITYSSADGGRAAHDLTLTRIDLDTDEVISHEVDERCTNLRSVVMPNGDLYLATSPTVAAENWLNSESSIQPCALRLRAGATSLDPAWQVSFGDWAGSMLWGDILRGSRGELLTLVAPESAAAGDPGGAYWAPIWQLWEVDPENGTAHRYGSLPNIAAYKYLRIDSRLHLRVPDTTDAQFETIGISETLTDVSDPESPVPGIRLPPTAMMLRFR